MLPLAEGKQGATPSSVSELKQDWSAPFTSKMYVIGGTAAAKPSARAVTAR